MEKIRGNECMLSISLGRRKLLCQNTQYCRQQISTSRLTRCSICCYFSFNTSSSMIAKCLKVILSIFYVGLLLIHTLARVLFLMIIHRTPSLPTFRLVQATSFLSRRFLRLLHSISQSILRVQSILHRY